MNSQHLRSAIKSRVSSNTNSAGKSGHQGIDFHRRSEMTLQKRLNETEYEKANAAGKVPM